MQLVARTSIAVFEVTTCSRESFSGAKRLFSSVTYTLRVSIVIFLMFVCADMIFAGFSCCTVLYAMQGVVLHRYSPVCTSRDSLSNDNNASACNHASPKHRCTVQNPWGRLVFTMIIIDHTSVLLGSLVKRRSRPWAPGASPRVPLHGSDHATLIVDSSLTKKKKFPERTMTCQLDIILSMCRYPHVLKFAPSV